jgi:hypothetical protein
MSTILSEAFPITPYEEVSAKIVRIEWDNVWKRWIPYTTDNLLIKKEEREWARTMEISE